MRGNIYIKGDLHLDVPMDASFLKSEGLTFHVRGDIFFHPKDDDFIFGEDDVCIEDIFDKLNVVDFITYSTENQNQV